MVKGLDIFRLAATLPQTKGPKLTDAITSDLVRFLNSFSASSLEWESILNALKGTLGGKVLPEVLYASIQNYFSLLKEQARDFDNLPGVVVLGYEVSSCLRFISRVLA